MEGQATGGFPTGIGTLVTEATGTLIRYAGEAQVGGLIASVGQRLILAAARKIIQQFFEEFSRQVPPADSPVSDVHPPT